MIANRIKPFLRGLLEYPLQATRAGKSLSSGSSIRDVAGSIGERCRQTHKYY